MYRILIKETLLNIANANLVSHPEYMDMYNAIEFGIPLARLDGDQLIRIAGQYFLQQNVKDYIDLDGYAFHHYYQTNVANLSAANTTNTTTLSTEFNNIKNDITANYFNGIFKNSLIQQLNSFPVNSKYWITEWNVRFDSNPLQIAKVGNTLLHSMFYFDHIMAFFDINANKNLALSCNKTNPINLANFHTVNQATDQKEAFVRFPNRHQTTYIDPLTTTNSGANDVKYNSPYYAHLLLKPILNDDGIKYLNNVNGGFTPVTDCYFRTFNKNSCSIACCFNDTYIYFDNKSGTDYSININAALPAFTQTSTNCQVVTKNLIYANNLFASMGKTTFRTNPNDDVITTNPDVSIQRAFNLEVKSTDYTNILIPKYSIGYVLVSRTSGSSSICSCGGNGSGRMASAFEINDKNIGNIEVYPNPNNTGKQIVEINESVSGIGNIELYDISGKIILTKQIQYNIGKNKFEIETNNLPVGFYLFKINTTNINLIKKIELTNYFPYYG